jgi:hypothetical protein
MADEEPAPIFAAIEANDFDEVRTLLLDDPELLESTRDDGLTPLMAAVFNADRTPEMIQLLVAAGADVNAATPEGYTALHVLVDVNGPSGTGELPGQIVQMLVAAGADLEARQHWGWTPLMRAVIEGTDDELQAFIDAGADVNRQFPDETFPEFLSGRTTLMAAASAPTKTALLLAAGADATARDARNETALDFARQCLADFDADPAGSEVIEETAAAAVEAILDQLKEEGIDLDAEEGDGLTVRQTVEEMLKASVEEARDYDYRGELLKTIALLAAAEQGP